MEDANKEKNVPQKMQWDSRYTGENFVYGTKPNQFFKSFIMGQAQKGRILLPAEGEGRNALFAAANGWQVDAFDFSAVARDKAIQWADAENVKINYTLASFEEVMLPSETFDAIALIYNHMPESKLIMMANKYFDALKPEGILILEAFAKDQIHNTTGGPKIIDLLFDIEEIKNAFSLFNIQSIHKMTIVLDEGPLHNGASEVIRMKAIKPSK